MTKRYPSLYSLKAFEAVGRHCSFKDAANELCVTPGALSQQVKKLECDLGFPVFIRQHQSLELTQQGRELKQTLCAAFKDISEAISKIQNQSQLMPLRVGCGTPVAAKWLAPRLPGFLDGKPKMSVEIVSERLLVDYSKENIDVGIRLTNDEDTSLDRVWLHEETAVLVCSPEYANRLNLRCPDDLSSATLLADDGLTYCTNQPIWQKWCDAANINSASFNNIVHFGYSPEQALDACIAGCGFMVASKTLASMDLAAGRLVIPCGPEVSTQMRYQIVTPKGACSRLDVKAFKAWVCDELKPYGTDECTPVPNRPSIPGIKRGSVFVN